MLEKRWQVELEALQFWEVASLPREVFWPLVTTSYSYGTRWTGERITWGHRDAQGLLSLSLTCQMWVADLEGKVMLDITAAGHRNAPLPVAEYRRLRHDGNLPRHS